ncbi:MAG: toll/interleukin-1 receptor domain-containing protein [Hyphomonadaceae bacterium]
MGHVFISYKREDVERARRIASLLAAEKMDVWWDQDVAGGEAWRSRIEQALNDAACVVVLWTAASTGVDGGFVRDEAARARARNVIVPVRFDRVAAPLGFGEVQMIDLSSWRGGAGERPARDLIESVRAKVSNRPALLKRRLLGPLGRRVAALCGAAAFAGCAFVVSANVFSAQDRLCAAPLPGLQPGISDLCGAISLGGRPTRAERLAWANLPKDDPLRLRAHIRRFPDGVFRGQAADLILAIEQGEPDTIGERSPREP